MKAMITGLVVLASAMAMAADKTSSSVAVPQVKEAKTKVWFIEPKDHSTVAKTFHVKMGVEGMKVCPAGTAPTDKACGHHHIIVDGRYISEGTVVPSNSTHLHFGKAQTETELTLTPGPHTLTLQFADFAHRSYGEKLSSTISVNVK